MHELEGTDVEAVHRFLNRVKGKAGLLVYVDSNGEVSGVGVWRTKRAMTQLENHLNVKLK